MSEFSPFSEETSPQPEQLIFTDMLATPQWGELREKVVEAENALVLLEDEDQTSERVQERLVEVAGDFGEILDRRYVGQPCQAVCLAYAAEDLKRSESTIGAEGDLELFSSNELVFYSVNLFYINQRWQAMVELYQGERTDRQESQPYYVPLREDCFMSLHVQEPAGSSDDDNEVDDGGEIDVQKVLGPIAEAAKKLVNSRDFLRATPDEQKALLGIILNDAENDYAAFERSPDEILAVRATQYYEVHDTMAALDPTLGYVDQRHQTGEHQVVTGAVARFDYPELEPVPEGMQLCADHFYMNSGAPCLVVRNDAIKTTYYVLPQSVEDII